MEQILLILKVYANRFETLFTSDFSFVLFALKDVVEAGLRPCSFTPNPTRFSLQMHLMNKQNVN